MAPRKSTKDAPADFDALLAEEPAVEDKGEEIVAGEEPEAAPVLTAAQERLAAARAAKAAREAAGPAAEVAAVDTDPYAGLTPDEIQELKDIEDEEARLNNARLIQSERAEPQFDNSRRGGTGEKILFHILKDGFTAFGDVWYRGQEIEIERGTPAYQRTLDRTGQSWLDIVDDEHAQYERWGERRIAPGAFRPLPGEKFDDALVDADLRRKRTVPIVAV